VALAERVLLTGARLLAERAFGPARAAVLAQDLVTTQAPISFNLPGTLHLLQNAYAVPACMLRSLFWNLEITWSIKIKVNDPGYRCTGACLGMNN
jgi:hypothetical protein